MGTMDKIEANKKLEPMIFAEDGTKFYRPNFYAQNLILKAMAGGVTDPKDIARITGMKSAAEVLRTLDKMAIRKEYHEALSRNGIDLDTIVNGIKEIAMAADKDDTRLKAYQTLLKSLGLEKYDKQEEGGKNWEQIILDISEKKIIDGEIGDTNLLEEPGEYEVNVPIMPVEEQKKKDEEKSLADEIYGSFTRDVKKT